MKKTGRNDPCPCGSGKKHKHCCFGKNLSQAAAAPTEETSIPSALQSAIEQHRCGRLAEAEATYRRILTLEPDHPDALHFLGVIFHQQGNHEIAVALINRAIAANPAVPAYYVNLGSALRGQGRLDEAVASYRQAISIKPDYAAAHNNLGGALLAQGKLDAAVASFKQAISIKPDFSDALYNLGNALNELGRLDEALASYRQALMFRPVYAEAHNNLGGVLQAQGRLDEAITNYRQALSFKPDYAEAYNNLGGALHAQGRLDEAIENFRRAVRLKPEYESALHFIAALTGKATERPPSPYIEKLFDVYANKFDQHLVQNLGYKMPQELLALLGQSVELPAGQWDVLDLGCGTGLSGLQMSPHARHLVGVDLSAKMLEKSRARNIYHRLEHSDLLPMMRGEGASAYDVIIAADVFVYLGRLDEVIAEARRLLRPGGYFMFSVEALDALAGDTTDPESSPGYTLNQSGRYAHTANYLENLAAANRFKPISLISTPVRSEKGMPIAAWAAVWHG